MYANYYYKLSVLLLLQIINICVYIHTHIHTQRSLATVNSIGFKRLKGKK